ncbi:MAG: hypothetical protein OEP52_11125, partial [Acidimicrobiia bacterium]|nr:hypothetical protein [Acidimicrobiia bacterium]
IPDETNPVDKEPSSPIDADQPADADEDQPDAGTPATDTEEAAVDSDISDGDHQATPADPDPAVAEQPDTSTPATHSEAPADEGRPDMTVDTATAGPGLEPSAPAIDSGVPADESASAVEDTPEPAASTTSDSSADVIEDPVDESPAAVSDKTPDVSVTPVLADAPAASVGSATTRGKAPKDHPVDHDDTADHDHGIGNDKKEPAADKPTDDGASDTTDPAPVQPVVDTKPTGPTGEVPSPGPAASPGESVQPPAVPDSPVQGPADESTTSHSHPASDDTVEHGAPSDEFEATGEELALPDVGAADFGADTSQTIVAEVRRLITSPFTPALPGGGALAHLVPLAAGELVGPAPRHTVSEGTDPRSAALDAAADAAEAMAVPAALGALTLLGWALKPGAVKLGALLRSLIG